MQQPELGKKIAELRKVKGLTQEELVEKCNISVRTLQRIEAGEVVPRSYTLRLIFSALDYSVEQHSSRLEKFTMQFFDLFNLKTNTMKKVSILSSMLAAIVVGVFFISTEIQAQNTKPELEENIEEPKKKGLYYSYFFCGGCMERKGLMIGRDMTVYTYGVKLEKIKLMIIDESISEFDGMWFKGTISENKIEIKISKGRVIDKDIEYYADNIKKSDEQVVLKGNAKVINYNYVNGNKYEDISSILANEIIINLE